MWTTSTLECLRAEARRRLPHTYKNEGQVKVSRGGDKKSAALAAVGVFPAVGMGGEIPTLKYCPLEGPAGQQVQRVSWLPPGRSPGPTGHASRVALG